MTKQMTVNAQLLLWFSENTRSGMFHLRALICIDYIDQHQVHNIVTIKPLEVSVFLFKHHQVHNIITFKT